MLQLRVKEKDMRKVRNVVAAALAAVMMALLVLAAPAAADEADAVLDELVVEEIVEEAEPFAEEEAVGTEGEATEPEEELPVEEIALEPVDESEVPEELIVGSEEPEPVADAPLGTTEPDDEPLGGGKNAGSAQSISVNSRVSDKVTDSNSSTGGVGGLDYYTWYRFTLSSPGWVQIKFDADYVTDKYGDWTFELYRSGDLSNEMLYSAFKFGQLSTQSSDKIGLPAGTYYLSVMVPYSFYTSSSLKNVNYRFNVNYTKSDVWEREPNDNAGTANTISANKTYYGSYTNNSDWYRFTVSSRSDVKIVFGGDYRDAYGYWIIRLQKQSQVGTSSNVVYQTVDIDELFNDKVVANLTLDPGTYYLSMSRGYLEQGLNYHFRVAVPPANTIPIYRMYNTKTSEHMWTKSKTEYESCGYGNYRDWNAEGIAWYAPTKSGTPVYRLYNRKSGDHHYTTSKGERSKLLASGQWRDEGVAFYSDDQHRVPLYRVYNGKLKRGQHHYTASKGERDALVKNNGWRNEGIGFYGAFKW